tara:strand:- start:7971 stop:8465 length:495 start_codon:yes stop_codon:yes gene_type:complete
MIFNKKKNKCVCKDKGITHEINWLCENVAVFAIACEEGDQEKMDAIRSEIKEIMDPMPEEFQYREPNLKIDDLDDIAVTDHIIIALNKRGYYANGGKDNIDTRSEGLGDSISKVLSSFGITEERFSKLLNRTGGCGCDGRKAFLNKLVPYKKKLDPSDGEPPKE